MQQYTLGILRLTTILVMGVAKMFDNPLAKPPLFAFSMLGSAINSAYSELLVWL